MPIPHTDNWWLAVILFVLFGSPALFSKAAARLPSVLGAAARWWQGRLDRTASSTVEALSARQMEDLVDKAVDERTEDLVTELADKSSWIAHISRWWRQAEITLAEANIELTPPTSYTQWEADRKRIREYHGQPDHPIQ